MVLWFNKKTPEVPREKKSAVYLFGGSKANRVTQDYKTLADDGYGQNPVAFACISKIAQCAASVDLTLFEKRGNKIERIESNHPMLDLIARPNVMQSGREFIYALVSQYLIGGRAFIAAVSPRADINMTPGEIKEMQLLDTASVSVIPGKTMLPMGYEYRTGANTKDIFPVNPISGYSRICHIKNFNPLNPFDGIAPLAAASFSVDTFNSGMMWNKNLMDNDARPSGALKIEASDGTPDDNELANLRAQIENSFSGAGNAGRPLLLSAGMDWQQLSISPKDMDYKENLLTAARFIASVYHVPPMLVNVPGESTFSNFAEAKLALWTDAVLPTLGFVLEGLNRWLGMMYGEQYYLWYDEEQIPALEPLRAQKFTRLQAASFMTDNEKRVSVGLDSYEGADTLFIDGSKVPLSIAADFELAEPGSAADSNSK